MYSYIRIGRLATALLIAFVLFVPLLSSEAASVYGRGTYSACVPNADCPTPPPTSTPVPPTIIETPSGIDFSVNLSDGQIISSPSYLVVVTPLNGQGRSAARVEILIDGRAAASLAPDTTGTFSWRWDIVPDTRSKVTIILYDQAGRTTKREINVRSGSLAHPAAHEPTSSNPVAAFINEVTQAATRAVRQIPVPVAYAFPYLLFALLGIGLLLLVWQTRREIIEAQALESNIRQAKTLSEEKTTFAQLASHYLRTPLAVLSGGVDILSSSQTASPPVVNDLHQSINTLHDKIEHLLVNIAGPAIPDAHDVPIAPSRLRVWLAPSFWGPLVLIGGLVILFNTLAAAASRITLTASGLLTQVAVFILLAIGLYMLLRSWILRRRARQRTLQLHADQVDLERARNQLISDSTQELSVHLAQIKSQLSGFPPSKGLDIARDGYRRFESVLHKFSIAASLESGVATDTPTQSIDLTNLINKSLLIAADQAQSKRLHLTVPPTGSINLRRPDLLQAVLSSLIDNAVAYSPAGGTVQIMTEGALTHTTITVTDQGPGIPADKLAGLFRPFSRADSALHFDHQGLGFSLYLDKLIMHYLGGDIVITSTPGRGLTATLTIPA